MTKFNHLVLCQGSDDYTIVTINSTLFGHTETEGSPLRDFQAVLTAANSLWVVMVGSISVNL